MMASCLVVEAILIRGIKLLLLYRALLLVTILLINLQIDIHKLLWKRLEVQISKKVVLTRMFAI